MAEDASPATSRRAPRGGESSLRRGARVALALLVLALFPACDEGPGEGARRIPEPERILRPMAAADSVPRQRPPASSRRALPLLAGGVPLDTLAVGAVDGSEGVVFGEITDVAVVGDAVVVLDAKSKQVLSVDRATGTVTDSAGGRGGGPREFRAPRGLGYDADDRRLFVVDARGKLNVYAVEDGGARLRFVETLGVRPGNTDVCATGDTLFFHDASMEGSGLVAAHAFREDGAGLRHLRSFGRVYDSDDPQVLWRMRRGEFACSPGADRIAFVSSLVGDVRVFGRAGALLWYSVIEESRPPPTWLKPRGGVRMEIPEEGGATHPHAVSATDGGGFVVQLARDTRDSRRRELPYAGLTTYWFSPDGLGEYLGPGHPAYRHVGNDVAIASREHPYPQLLILEPSDR